MNQKYIITLIVLAVAGGVMLPGCGGDSGEARQYITQGDKTIAVIDAKSKTIGKDMETLFDGLYKEISGGKTPDVEAFNSGASEIKTLADQMIRSAGSARARFKKVDALKEVPQYKKYADLKVRIIDANVQGLKQLESFLDQSRAKLAAKGFDPIAFQQFVTEFADSIAKQGDKSGNLQKQAERLKKQQKL